MHELQSIVFTFNKQSTILLIYYIYYKLLFLTFIHDTIKCKINCKNHGNGKLKYESDYNLGITLRRWYDTEQTQKEYYNKTYKHPICQYRNKHKEDKETDTTTKVTHWRNCYKRKTAGRGTSTT